MTNNKLRFNPKALDTIFEIQQDGDPTLLQTLCDEYEKILPTTLSQIETALNSQNHEQAELCAHSLKSSSALLGLEIVSQLCWQIEEKASDQIFDMDSFSHLKDEAPAALQELNQFRAAV